MSESILKALMQLFAIIAKVDYSEDSGEIKADESSKEIIELFLNQRLSQEYVEKYLDLFYEFLKDRHGKSRKKDGKKKRTSVNSVKVLRICTQINEELEQKQKIIVLIRILEFVFADDEFSNDELEFAETVAETFNISQSEYEQILQYVKGDDNDLPKHDNYLNICSQANSEKGNSKQIIADGLEGIVSILRVKSVKSYFIKYNSKSELFLNGQLIIPYTIKVLRQGSSIKNSKINPIYYSDIIAQFLSEGAIEKIEFTANKIEYEFQNGHKGLHEFTFKEESGRLIGIMGGSGSGKSTLLNVLNGNYAPSSGEIKINGIDLYKSPEKLEGVIGFVPQDDLLIEELTVFENLFYNAKLCFGNYDDEKIIDLVDKVLYSIGLQQAKDLKVGSPLAKTISGGQRKRLNIALELIREPAILFVDEPTSGLSSNDSEVIMDLLKILALKGKLIYVVIHQPSSDIYKMFDQLIILDVGGFPIYKGDPVDAVVYFKKLIQHVNAEESECETCGNVNPEQIFNIIDMKVVDEYGVHTGKRKVEPTEWNESYSKLLKEEPKENEEQKIPESIFKVPDVINQFKIFFKRDIKSKLTNTQYLIITLFEAPILAGILSFFMKYLEVSFLDNHFEYSFYNSENLTQYLFISVIVALFIGLTTSAEEIIGNLKILQREKFLNLSKGSYLFSKIGIMFLISAIQTLFYVIVGNYILEIRGMFFSHWMILFSTSCFANLLGLNISSSFNSVKVIYILIPICIIPQLLFSGIIVPFDKLHPYFSSKSQVPVIGNVMASRWAYEAMTVTQFKDNEYEKIFFECNKEMSFANWKKDQWESNLETKLNNFYRSLDLKGMDRIKKLEVKRDGDVLINEITKEINNFKSSEEFKSDEVIKLLKTIENRTMQKEDYLALYNYLGSTKIYYRKAYKIAEKKKDAALRKFLGLNKKLTEKLKKLKTEKVLSSKDYRSYKKLMTRLKDYKYQKFKNAYSNHSLEDFVTNSNTLNFITEDKNSLIQKSDPIYLDPYNHRYLGAHFYAPSKNLFGYQLDTFSANILVIWFMTLLLTITLYYDVLRKVIENSGFIFKLIKLKPIKK
jgi:ABC-type multidrug transport system ATPase subunit